MERRHLYLNEGYHLNPYGKTKSARRKVFLSRRAADVLRRRLANVEGPFVFPSTRGGNDSSRHIVKLNAAHNGAVRRAKLDPFRLDDLRHAFATRRSRALNLQRAISLQQSNATDKPRREAPSA